MTRHSSPHECEGVLICTYIIGIHMGICTYIIGIHIYIFHSMVTLFHGTHVKYGTEYMLNTCKTISCTFYMYKLDLAVTVYKYMKYLYYT